MVSQRLIQDFLKQQLLLYGNELYLSSSRKLDVIDKVENSNLISDDKNLDSLNEYEKSISTCDECSLNQTRTKFVFGVGDPNADLLLVGEAPGENEDQKGEPFVGRAGKLLDDILRAINKKRGDGVFITNVLKWRPPNDRDPLPSEISHCELHLGHEIALIQPKLIVALGRIAGKTLLSIDSPLEDMRGEIHDYKGTPLIITYHPAVLLRNPDFKSPTWTDFKRIRDYLN